MKCDKLTKLYLSYLVVIFSNLLLLLFLKDYFFIQTLSLIFGTISVIDLLFGLYIWYYKNKTLNSAFIYFILCCYICWFGQIIVCGLSLLPSKFIDINSFSAGDFIRTGVFALVGFGLLFFGGLLGYNDNKSVTSTKKMKNKNLSKSLLIASLGMILISFLGHYYDLINKLIISLTSGYASLYEENNITTQLNNVYINLKMFFWPGLFFLLTACKENKKIFNIVLVIAIIDIILNFIIGTRSDALVIILALFWFYTNEYKKLSFKGYFVSFIALIFLTHLISTIASFRLLPDKNLSLFIKEFLSLENNPIIKTVNEFGFNIFSLHHTIRLIPSTRSFGFGYTYLAAIMAIIPSFLIGGYSFAANAALPDWLKITLNMDYGPGYSILAESYYNFGYLGLIIMFLIGILIGRVVTNKLSGDKRIIKNCIIAIIIYLNIFIARDTFLMVFREIFYCIAVPIFLLFICYKFFEKKSNNKFINDVNNLCNNIYNVFNPTK